MMDINVQTVLMKIFDWSEVWGVLIPLIVLYGFRRQQPPHFRPVIIYLLFALAINIVIDIIQDFKPYLPFWMQKNNVLYNVHSVARFVCFASYFSMLNPRSFKKLKKIVPIIFIVFLLVNFSIAENFLYPDHISGNLHAAESFLLLIYCMGHYLSELKEDRRFLLTGKDFLVVTGLSIYVVTNFFIFLFYVPMLTYNKELAINMWYIHNAAYILLCVFIARSFYVPA
jgi:hypothetical protein